MKHFTSYLDWKPAEIERLLDAAAELKGAAAIGPRPAYATRLQDRILGLMFFSPSLRTLFSSQAAMQRLGGGAIPLHIGQGTWLLEHRDGVRMDGAASEHIREAAPVLSRYADALAVRCFAGMKSSAEDAEDALIRSFARHATVPVINLESAMEHPCQALADMLTARELLGATQGRNFTLTWAPQAKATPMAVPHSAMLAAAWAGMHVRLLHPKGYDLNPTYVDAARRECQRGGARFEISHDPAQLQDSDVIYVKSWGRSELYGLDAEQQADFRNFEPAWRVSQGRLKGTAAPILHCLPVRRDVVIDSAVLDGPHSRVVDQAENRMWVFMALLLELLAGGRMKPGSAGTLEEAKHGA